MESLMKVKKIVGKKEGGPMKRLQLSPVICFTIFLFGAMAGSAGAKSEGYKEISAPEVKNLIEKQKAVVVNLLSE